MASRLHPVSDYLSVLGPGTQFIDVRRADEFHSGTLDGAVNIEVDHLASRIPELDSEHRTIVFCRSGGRSARAAALLVAAGFTDVVDLEGGMLAYNQEGTT